jgi:MYXO-CTERM domain-containing protein
VLVAATALLALFLGAGTAFANDIEYCNFSSVAGLQLNGNAVQVGNTLRLTRNVTFQDSSAFRTPALTLASSTDFHTHFQFVLTPGGNGQADGVTFSVQADARGSTALGGNGGGIGYGAANGGTRIQPSVEVEFDAYQNPWDPNNNHVGVMLNGDETTHVAVGTPAFGMASGTAIDAWIDYAAATTTLSVYVSNAGTKPATALVTATVNVFATVGASAYFGFTGSTGGQSEQQVLDMWILALGGLSECTCTSDAQCAAPTPRCENPPGVCVQCLTGADCGGTTPVCDTTTHTCGPCTSDAQCGGATPYCAPAGDPLAGSCVACVTDAECDGSPNSKTPICDKSGGASTDTCRACGSNAECTTASLEPVCVTGGAHAGQCAQCAGNTDCTSATPVCLDTGATNQCVQCTTDASCSGKTPVCNTTTHACGPCTSDADCTAPTPACQTSGTLAGECTQCSATNASQCKGPIPVCNVVTGTCVGCNTNADCAAPAPICFANACVGCTSDYTTSNPPPRSCPTAQLPACQTSGTLAGECTQCSSTNASVCAALPQQPVCVAGKEECGCAQDSDCGVKTGMLCDPAQPPAGKCVPGCKVTGGTDNCPPGEVCVGGTCQAAPPDAGADGGDAGTSSSSGGADAAIESGSGSGGDGGGDSGSSSGGGDSGGGGGEAGIDSGGAPIDASSGGGPADGAANADAPVSLEGGGCAAGGTPASSLVIWGSLVALVAFGGVARRRRSRDR